MLQGLLGGHSQGIRIRIWPKRGQTTPTLNMTQAALGAPDHSGLMPFRSRSCRVQGEALAALFALGTATRQAAARGGEPGPARVLMTWAGAALAADLRRARART